MAPKVDVKDLCGGDKMSDDHDNKDCVCSKTSKAPLKQENSRPKYRSMSACDVNLSQNKKKPSNPMKTETPPTSLSNLKEKKTKIKRGSTPHIDRISKEKQEKHVSAYTKLIYFWKKFHKSFSNSKLSLPWSSNFAPIFHTDLNIINFGLSNLLLLAPISIITNDYTAFVHSLSYIR